MSEHPIAAAFSGLAYQRLSRIQKPSVLKRTRARGPFATAKARFFRQSIHFQPACNTQKLNHFAPHCPLHLPICRPPTASTNRWLLCPPKCTQLPLPQATAQPGLPARPTQPHDPCGGQQATGQLHPSSAIDRSHSSDGADYPASSASTQSVQVQWKWRKPPSSTMRNNPSGGPNGYPKGGKEQGGGERFRLKAL